MLLRTYMASFGILVLEGIHIKQEELNGWKLILILQGIMFLFSESFNNYFSWVYFSLSIATNDEK